jgi:DNA-binding response OmpR family regulator
MAEPWRVLLADDDIEVCALINTILKRGSYALTICNEAESALLHIRGDAAFDIIICDFRLPGISGLEFIAQVRAGAASANVPIIMISGHTALAMNARAERAGADAFLNKPFALAEFRSTVETLLDGRFSLASAP